MFFITVGAGIDLARIAAEPLRILGLPLAFMTLKMAVLWSPARLFGLGARARLLFTLGLARAGEFSFLLQAAIVEAALRGRLASTVEGAEPPAAASPEGKTVRRSDIVASQHPPH